MVSEKDFKALKQLADADDSVLIVDIAKLIMQGLATFDKRLNRFVPTAEGQAVLNQSYELKLYQSYELEELRKDAERYRYMRLNATFQKRNGPGIYWYLSRWNNNLPIGERLDNAIDEQLDNTITEE
jgi:hypothetical protein